MPYKQSLDWIRNIWFHINNQTDLLTGPQSGRIFIVHKYTLVKFVCHQDSKWHHSRYLAYLDMSGWRDRAKIQPSLQNVPLAFTGGTWVLAVLTLMLAPLKR